MSDSPERERLLAARAAPRPVVPPRSLTAEVARLFQRISWGKAALFVVSLFLFILAITLMKEGARGLAPFVRDTLRVDNPVSSLGFGWLFSYLVMSGSPVAAAALTFFDAGVVDELSTFAMITGSRLGASFIVLLIGFIYVMRGRDRVNSLGMGLLSLIVTGSTHVLGLVLGAWLLLSGLLDGFKPSSGVVLTSVTDLIFDPAAALFTSFLPGWALFFVGLGIILVSFNLFDKCLPEMAIKESQFGRVSRLVYRPGVMFLLGAGVTMISMSVSVSLSVLVPLSNRGFVRRENVIPYIMGANVTTFIDTLLAAVLLNNPAASTIVLAEMVSIAIVSLLLLLTVFERYERLTLRSVTWLTNRNRNLALFVIAIFVIPLLLLLL